MNEDKALKILAEAFDKAVKEFGEKKLVESLIKQGETIEIKVGQKWRTRGGDVVEIVEDDGSVAAPFKSNKGLWYDRNGDLHGCKPSKHDLIELVQDNPKSTAESLRERILEIDKERAELVNQLEELGFSLIENLEPKDWQKGDVVECISPFSDCITEGKMYVILCGEDRCGDVLIKEDDDGDTVWRPSECFKFLCRPY